MKVEVNEKTKNKELDFPKLMTGKHGLIVLFDKIESGTVIKGEKKLVGHYAEDWDLSSFKDFKGSITLTQE